MDQVRISIEIPREPAQVWRALFTPAVRRLWWAPRVNLKPEAGSTFIEYWRDGDGRERTSEGKVVEVRDNELLALSWRDDDWPAATTVKLELTRSKSGSTLELLHQGFEALGPSLQYNVEEYQQGWTSLLEDLRDYLAGAAVELEEPIADEADEIDNADATVEEN
jgi:uncharacterized protein YndB with AHSA1/START domain